MRSLEPHRDTSQYRLVPGGRGRGPIYYFFGGACREAPNRVLGKGGQAAVNISLRAFQFSGRASRPPPSLVSSRLLRSCSFCKIHSFSSQGSVRLDRSAISHSFFPFCFTSFLPHTGILSARLLQVTYLPKFSKSVKMQFTVSAALTAALAAQNVAAHATFQQLWVDGVDYVCSRRE